MSVQNPSPRGGRKPAWLKVPLPGGPGYARLKSMARELNLHTVCEEARCPNVGECWSGKHPTMTLMVLGDECTRRCRFCAVKTVDRAAPPDPQEPLHVGQAVAEMDVGYVVITSVDRDDLPDGGAGHYAECVRQIRARSPRTVVETLIPDYSGADLRVLMAAAPDVLAHNVEVVPRLQRKIRDPRCSYERSLETLREARQANPDSFTKSSLMVGLGESRDEVLEAMQLLRDADVDFLTIGQYLRPTPNHAPVAEYVEPATFADYQVTGERMGFRYVAAGPLVRSSYKAGEFFFERMVRERRQDPSTETADRRFMTATRPLTVIEPDGGVNGYDPGLSEDELVHCYRTMLAVRAFDETCLKLQRSGRIGFSIPNVGIEACQVGAASAIRKSDWIFPSYRDFGMALYHGISPLRMMHNMFGNASDTAKGRQMPVHFSFAPPEDPLHFVSISSPIGTHIPQAVGAAFAAQRRGEDTVVLTSFGDGGTSSLGFHSGMNFAGVWKAPVVFLCQNNGWAISCPIESQTASDGFAVKAEGYGMPGVIVDGNDLLAMRKAVLEAVARARAGGGPTLIEAKTFRMGGHSTSDDPKRYVPPEQFEEWGRKDPILRFEKYLQAAGLWTSELGDKLRAEVSEEIAEAARTAEKVGPPGIETIFSDVYEDIPPHIRRQGEEAFDIARRHGEATSGDGEFPL